MIASWVLNFNQNTSSNQLPKTKRMSIRPTLETPALSLHWFTFENIVTQLAQTTTLHKSNSAHELEPERDRSDWSVRLKLNYLVDRTGSLYTLVHVRACVRARVALHTHTRTSARVPPRKCVRARMHAGVHSLHSHTNMSHDHTHAPIQLPPFRRWPVPLHPPPPPPPSPLQSPREWSN